MSPETTLILMCGLPYSGKSTKARQMGYPIVCPDAIRLALHGERFLYQAEPMVWLMAKYMVRSLFLAGHRIVTLDATNITVARRKEWAGEADQVRVFYVGTPEALCIHRAKDAGDEEIIPVIQRMAGDIEPPTLETGEQL